MKYSLEDVSRWMEIYHNFKHSISLATELRNPRRGDALTLLTVAYIPQMKEIPQEVLEKVGWDIKKLGERQIFYEGELEKLSAETH